MSVLQNFKNIPWSPYGGRQGSNVIFFLQICNKVSGEKKKGSVAPPQTGDRAMSPVGGRQALFSQGPRWEFEEKKLHLRPVSICC